MGELLSVCCWLLYSCLGGKVGILCSVYVGREPALRVVLIPCNSARLELQLHCMESTLDYTYCFVEVYYVFINVGLPFLGYTYNVCETNNTYLPRSTVTVCISS